LLVAALPAALLVGAADVAGADELLPLGAEAVAQPARSIVPARIANGVSRYRRGRGTRVLFTLMSVDLPCMNLIGMAGAKSEALVLATSRIADSVH